MNATPPKPSPPAIREQLQIIRDHLIAGRNYDAFVQITELLQDAGLADETAPKEK